METLILFRIGNAGGKTVMLYRIGNAGGTP